MKKLYNRKSFLKRVGILLIAAIMIVSSTAVAATLSIPSRYVEEGRLGETILYEGFEDGVMPPPGGWETFSNSQSDNHWEITSEPGLVHTGDYAGLVTPDSTYPQDEWLVSPEVDLTGNYETVNLSFWTNATFYSLTGTVYVKVEVDGMDHEVWDMVDDEPDWNNSQMYRLVDLDLSEFIGNVVRIKWQYFGQTYAWFALDEIFVYVGEIELPEIKIGDITGGWAGLGKGALVSAEIKNVGVGNASDVAWTISITGNGVIRELNWSFNGTIPLLLAGGLEIVNTPEDAGIYGFGIINITVHAREPKYGSEDTKSVNGFLFFFLIIITGNDDGSYSYLNLRG